MKKIKIIDVFVSENFLRLKKVGSGANRMKNFIFLVASYALVNASLGLHQFFEVNLSTGNQAADEIINLAVGSMSFSFVHDGMSFLASAYLLIPVLKSLTGSNVSTRPVKFDRSGISLDFIGNAIREIPYIYTTTINACFYALFILPGDFLIQSSSTAKTILKLNYFSSRAEKIFESICGVKEGEFEAFQHHKFPPGKHSDLYTPVSEDLTARVADGRLPNGDLAATQVFNCVSQEALKNVVQMGVFSGIAVLPLALLFFVVLPLINSDDVFSLTSFSDNISPVSALLLSVISTLFFVAAVVRMVAHHKASEILAAVDQIANTTTKDAVVRYKSRSEMRAMEDASRKAAINLESNLYQNNLPIYVVGRSSGFLRTRGVLNSPIKNMPLALDEDSIFQHILALGATGQGKSRLFLTPFVDLVCRVSKECNRSSKFFLMDGKAVLTNSLKPTLEKHGIDVKIIGTGENEFGMNVIADMSTEEFGAVAESILNSLDGGGGNDAFWIEKAVSYAKACFVIFKESGKRNAFDLLGLIEEQPASDEFTKMMAELLGEDPSEVRRTYSDELIFELKKSVENNEKELTVSLDRAMTYLTGSWKNMANETKSGIISQATRILDDFVSSDEIVKKFGMDSEGATSLQELFDVSTKNFAIGLNVSVDKNGTAAKLILLTIKTIFYRMARNRQSVMGEDACRKDKIIFLADEFQEFLSQGNSGMSDTSFANVARSTGVSMLFSTQSLSTVEKVVKDKPTVYDFFGNFRNVFCQKTEDEETIKYLSFLIGKNERNRVFDDSFSESWETICDLYGDPLEKVRAVSEEFLEKTDKGIFDPDFHKKIRSVKVFGGSESFRTDDRFSYKFKDDADLANYRKTATFRAEDKTLEHYKTGNEMQDGITASDVSLFATGMAFAFTQRCQKTIMDVIYLEMGEDDER